LAEIGKLNQSAAGGDRVSDEAKATAFANIGTSASPKHNTRDEIAKAAGVSHSTVAMAEIGAAKYRDTVGRPSETIVTNIGNEYLPKHNTQAEIAN